MSRPRNILTFFVVQLPLLLVVAVYLMAVWAAYHYWLVPAQGGVAYVATRDLERNRLIQPDDIDIPPQGPGHWGWFLPDRPALEGKYVVAKKTIPKNDPISLEDVQSSLDLTMDSRYQPVSVLLDKQPEVRASLNAQSNVDVYGSDSKLVVQNVRVHGIYCGKASVDGKTSIPSCYAVLEIADCILEAVLAKKDGMRLIPTR